MPPPPPLTDRHDLYYLFLNSKSFPSFEPVHSSFAFVLLFILSSLPFRDSFRSLVVLQSSDLSSPFPFLDGCNLYCIVHPRYFPHFFRGHRFLSLNNIVPKSSQVVLFLSKFYVKKKKQLKEIMMLYTSTPPH